MFEEYLEKELLRHIKIIKLLWDNESLTSIELAEELEVTAATIKSDVKSINMEYCEKNNPLLISSPQGYAVLNREQRERKTYIKRIYSCSLFVKATCFFLKNNLSNIDKFEELEYISSAKAYNVKKEVRDYLERLEILEEGKFVQFAEYRIRFLMAFFQWELNMPIVKIPEENRAIYNILFKEIEAQEKGMFSDSSKEYAMILFQLSFLRRRNNPVSFPPEEEIFIKNTVVYKSLQPTIRLFLTKMLHFEILDEEATYFVLVFNIMNINYNEELSENLKVSTQSLKENTKVRYYSLIQCFESEFEITLSDAPIFEAALMIFLRKCLFNLQIFIPEEHIALGNIPKLPNEILVKTKSALDQWNTITGLNLNFSKAHIVQLSSKIFFVLRKKSKPKIIYLLTGFYSDYLLGKEILTSEYGGIVKIRRFNPEMQKEYHQNDLILYDSNYTILDKYTSKKLKINYIFDLQELQRIRALLFGYNLDGLESDVNGEIKSTSSYVEKNLK
ncbi:HTH domain-containing protein [Lactococcus garvieae]|uniref:HTH domain-containing protein n=1 Tax=Lactococcus garvieae TaxID=1363 RepID=A0AA46TVF0_9LACT|nr:HTH domain-containing protein [Lactococcus garvieae]UYT10281.1 HTH domain-containing protein [Lactococcus garvieae]UYT12311.1 HTH domain-containing protein [Lactococcus garvieae]